MDLTLNNSIDRFIDNNYNDILRDISRLVAINSVEGEASAGAPFGAGPAAALDKALEISRELGLDTENSDGYIGWAQLKGEEDKYIATITHLDVVPVGEGWTSDPFTMREREGYIIGRGVMDDKGPTVLCLYALKYLKEHNIPLRYTVRALLGVNEETGMKDVEYYLSNYPAPAFCFSPDANFPLCNGEKGISHGRMISDIALDKIVDIHGGFAPNAIPDKAHATVRAVGLKPTTGVEVREDGDVTHLTAYGIGGHASLPKGTVNAIGVLVDYILNNNIVCGGEEKYLRLLQKLHCDFSGGALGVAADDGLFEPLTIIGGVISTENGVICQMYDTRYPTNTNGAKIAAQIGEKAGDFAHVEMIRDTEPFYMSLDNPAVKVCTSAYNDVTNEGATPYTIGGGTYARDFPNAVSFGPEHSDRPFPDFAGPIHGVDEAACIADFMEALKVYIITLIELQKIEY